MDGRVSIRWSWLAAARCRRGRASSVPTNSTSCGPTLGRAHTTGRLRIGVGHLKAAETNSALFTRLQEIPRTVRVRGGPGRTRTSNQDRYERGYFVGNVDKIWRFPSLQPTD